MRVPHSSTVGTSEDFVNFNGATPTGFRQSIAASSASGIWSPTAPSVYYFESSTKTFSGFDCLNPDGGVFPLTTSSDVATAGPMAFPPNSPILAFGYGSDVYLYDTTNKNSSPVSTSFDALYLSSAYVRRLIWSADAAFMAVVLSTSTTSTTDSVYVMRTQGVFASAPIAPWTLSTSRTADVSFQP
jgi:hypothetical protein